MCNKAKLKGLLKYMDFMDFKESINENKLHMLSEKSLFYIKVDEPTYLLKASGGTSQKAYLHRLSDIKAATKSFFKTISLTQDDRWGICLSTKHVAGFSILARSYFGNLKDPYFFTWSVESVCSKIVENKLSVLSLVPTQIFDLVFKGVKAPEKLKYVFVGGSHISKKLFQKAQELGWPVVGCYGLTETFAQMSYSVDGVNLKAFPGWEVSLSADEEITLKGPGLYWAKLKGKSKLIIRDKDIFYTGDQGKLGKDSFQILGKTTGKVKIKGSYFDFNKFKKDFSAKLLESGFSNQQLFPLVLKEERNGAGLYLITTQPLFKLKKILNSTPQFRGVFKMNLNIFSEIGKPIKSKLEDELLKTVVSL